jgi:hypothetical protein
LYVLKKMNTDILADKTPVLFISELNALWRQKCTNTQVRLVSGQIIRVKIQVQPESAWIWLPFEAFLV